MAAELLFLNNGVGQHVILHLIYHIIFLCKNIFAQTKQSGFLYSVIKNLTIAIKKGNDIGGRV